jgi:hypothetical protein
VFGRRDETERLQAQLDALEQRVIERVEGVETLLEQRLKQIEARLDDEPADRVRMLLNSVAEDVRTDLAALLDNAGKLRNATEEALRRNAELEAAAEQMVTRLSGEEPHPSRIKVQFNRVYQAKSLGYVAAYFVGGRADRVSILIGEESPPTKSWAELNTTNDINSYAGAVVRPGEYWMAKAKVGSGSGVRCTYTPFY